MLRRLSVLGSLLLAACVPAQGPGGALYGQASCYITPPTRAEAAAWRAAQSTNTARAYRAFINNYPRSCYVPAATDRLSRVVTKKPPPVRNPPPRPKTDSVAGQYP